MEIVHFINEGDAYINRYVHMLLHTVDEVDKGNGNGRWKHSAATTAAQLRAHIGDASPAIIHLHGQPGMKELLGIGRLLSDTLRIVVSPHGVLSAWNRKGGLELSIYQSLVKRAYVVVAQSEIERKEIETLGWNNRVEVVTSPVYSKLTNAQAVAQSLTDIYNKVMRSYVRPLLSEESLRALSLILNAGASRTADFVREAVSEVEWGQVEWERIIVYAYYEGVVVYLYYGIKTLGLTLPDSTILLAEQLARSKGMIDVEAISCYTADDFRLPAPATDADVPTLLSVIQQDMVRQQLPLLRIVELTELMLSADIDDDVVSVQLADDRQKKSLLASLMWICAEQTELTEGFMVMPPIDNNLTKQLRKLIDKNMTL